MAASIIDIKNADIFQNDALILGNVNLKVVQGEFCYLIGKTGSGKSSFLKTLYGELPLKKGQGTVVEYDLTKLTWEEVPYLRRKMGIIFQDFNLLMDRNIFSNLSFVLEATGWKNKTEISTRVSEVLALVGLETKGFKMPHEMSGGEQQRIVIARALLNKPELILADEPTGNLDPDTSDEIMKVLFNLSREQNVTCLIATHDYNVMGRFPARIIRCQSGKLMDEDAFSI